MVHSEFNLYIIESMSNAMTLTTKQRVFIACINRGMSGTQAAKISYQVPNDNVAAVIASENLRKPKIQAALENTTNEYVIIDNALRCLKDELKAEKYLVRAKVYVPDHATRLKAIRTLLRMQGVRV